VSTCSETLTNRPLRTWSLRAFRGPEPNALACPVSRRVGGNLTSAEHFEDPRQSWLSAIRRCSGVNDDLDDVEPVQGGIGAHLGFLGFEGPPSSACFSVETRTYATTFAPASTWSTSPCHGVQCNRARDVVNTGTHVDNIPQKIIRTSGFRPFLRHVGTPLPRATDALPRAVGAIGVLGFPSVGVIRQCSGRCSRVGKGICPHTNPDAANMRPCRWHAPCPSRTVPRRQRASLTLVRYSHAPSGYRRRHAIPRRRGRVVGGMSLLRHGRWRIMPTQPCTSNDIHDWCDGVGLKATLALLTGLSSQCSRRAVIRHNVTSTAFASDRLPTPAPSRTPALAHALPSSCGCGDV